MASITTRPNGNIEVKIKTAKKFTGKFHYKTFAPHEREQAEAWGDAMELQLRKGVVPAEFLAELEAPKERGGDFTSAASKGAGATKLLNIVNAYCAARRVSASDNKLYDLIIKETGNPMLSEMTLQWAERLVAAYKEPKVNLAPSSIRKRIGALTRCCDWFQSQEKIERPISFGKSLGRGYSHYPNGERTDESRERLYKEGEEARVLNVLNGVTERGPSKLAIHADLSTPALKSLYTTIRHTGMRLKEAYTLRVGQIDFKGNLIQVNGSKGHYGASKPRYVAMMPIVKEILKEACKGKQGNELVFPYWTGDEATHTKWSAYLSQLFGRLFSAAGVLDMREHDLRHVATVQWVTLKDGNGRWMFSESEIMQMMGWSSRAMLDRYIKGFRAEDLGSRLNDLAMA